MRGGPQTPPTNMKQSADDEAAPIGGAEAAGLLSRVCGGFDPLLLAVSGGGDSTALLVLVAEWAEGAGGPKLFVASVDHGLRAEAGEEIAAVAALCASLDLPVARLAAPVARATRIEEAAREARYAALATHAKTVGAEAIVLAHTLDDQAETVLMRLAAGSGPAGLKAMAETSRRDGITLVRPFLSIPKARLAACLKQRRLAFASDKMNADPRFARARLRSARGVLAREGLTAERLATLAFRMARAEAALEQATDAALQTHVEGAANGRALGPGAAALPDEVKLRLLGRVVAAVGGGRLRLERLERLADRIVTRPSGAATLGGAKIVWSPDGRIVVTPAPPRGRGAPDGEAVRRRPKPSPP